MIVSAVQYESHGIYISVGPSNAVGSLVSKPLGVRICLTCFPSGWSTSKQMLLWPCTINCVRMLFNVALKLEIIVSTAGAVKFWHAVGGLYMLVHLHHQPSPLTKFNTVLTAGSTLRLLITSGVSSEGAALAVGRYGSVIAP